MRSAFANLIGRSALSALVVGFALAAPSVAAANPVCGSFVRHNTTLTADMTCPTSSGIVVGKAGITINLNGHTLSGGNSTNSVGIDDSSGHDRVTVENGTIEHFSYGVYFQYTTGSSVLHVKALNNSSYGVAYLYSQHGTVRHVTASNTSGEYGFYLYADTNVNLTSVKAAHDYYGLYDEYSLDTVDEATGNSNVYGFYISEPLWVGSAYYTVENSTANNNSNTGFYISGNYPSTYYQAIMIHNTANDNTDYGFHADGQTKGKDNHAAGNGTNCWHVPCT
jgi:hypothetical protein